MSWCWRAIPLDIEKPRMDRVGGGATVRGVRSEKRRGSKALFWRIRGVFGEKVRGRANSSVQSAIPNESGGTPKAGVGKL